VDKFIQMGGNVTESIKPTLVNASSQDDSLDVQQWQRYIEQEIGFVLPNVQRKWLINAIDKKNYGISYQKIMRCVNSY